jgi:hypothetical protein
VLTVGVAAPVNAQTTPTIDITSATLVAKGAAVDVDVTITCDVSTFAGGVSVTVTQRSGNVVMEGSGSVSPLNSCTGEPQIVTVPVLAQAGGRPFKIGEAVATGHLSACTPLGCDFVNTTQTIRITR